MCLQSHHPQSVGGAALPNGLELSCPAARATVDSFSRIPAGKSHSTFPHASRVSCSELLGSPLGETTAQPP
jgi:hypothetical protein